MKVLPNKNPYYQKMILNLVFSLIFQEVTTECIMAQEHRHLMNAYRKLETISNLHILGRSSADRLPILSLVIVHPISMKQLHYNFVAALLNDLFGVQSRGGCACAGPYAQVRCLHF